MMSGMKKRSKSCLGYKVMLNEEKMGTVFLVYMRREGRVTIPKELRDAYDLKEGDLVECKIRKIK